MKTLEKNLWDWLKRGCRGQFHEKSLYLGRVENLVGSGDPDVDGCLAGSAFKLELKTAARPALEGTCVAVKFRPAQVPWLERYGLSGGRAYVLVQVGSGHAARRYLIRSRDAAAVELGVPECSLSRLSVTRFDATAAEIVSAASGGP